MIEPPDVTDAQMAAWLHSIEWTDEPDPVGGPPGPEEWLAAQKAAQTKSLRSADFLTCLSCGSTRVKPQAPPRCAKCGKAVARAKTTKAFNPELHPRAADGEFGEGAGHEVAKVVEEAGNSDDDGLTAKQRFIASAIDALNKQPDANAAVWDATRTAIAKVARADYQERMKNAPKLDPRISHLEADPVPSKPDPEQMLSDANQPDGGFTWNPNTGQVASFGFAVAVGSREKIVDAPLTLDVVKQYVKDNSDKVDMRKKGNFVGAWNNPENGKIYLDVSTVTSNAERARRLCGTSEISFFDLQTFKSVTVNPTKVVGSEES